MAHPTVEAGWIILGLQERGFVLSLKDGKVIVNPGERLTTRDMEQIKAHRDEIYSLLECPERELAAMRCETDPPDFGDGHTMMRESVIIRAEGWPLMIFSQESVRQSEETNRAAQERHDKANRVETTPVVGSVKKPSKSSGKGRQRKMIEDVQNDR